MASKIGAGHELQRTFWAYYKTQSEVLKIVYANEGTQRASQWHLLKLLFLELMNTGVTIRQILEQEALGVIKMLDGKLDFNILCHLTFQSRCLPREIL